MSQLTTEQVAAFSDSNSVGACGGLTVDHLANLTSQSFGGFTTVCISKLENNALNRVTAAQLAQLSPAAVSGNLLLLSISL